MVLREVILVVFDDLAYLVRLVFQHFRHELGLADGRVEDIYAHVSLPVCRKAYSLRDVA